MKVIDRKLGGLLRRLLEGLVGDEPLGLTTEERQELAALAAELKDKELLHAESGLEWYRREVKARHGVEGTIEIDEGAEVSESDDGAYVQAWIHVYRPTCEGCDDVLDMQRVLDGKRWCPRCRGNGRRHGRPGSGTVSPAGSGAVAGPGPAGELVGAAGAR